MRSRISQSNGERPVASRNWRYRVRWLSNACSAMLLSEWSLRKSARMDSVKRASLLARLTARNRVYRTLAALGIAPRRQHHAF